MHARDKQSSLFSRDGDKKFNDVDTMLEAATLLDLLTECFGLSASILARIILCSSRVVFHSASRLEVASVNPAPISGLLML